ncbi:winged helix-turn-helix transcriptional regulator [Limosilactobacillus sp. WF-MT5-A]|uniref:winged helix-turn-helix transcriptional regulator n=1 Tax=Limosilactobacillus agrestis TaxID=2759748 RepID=UPI0015FA735B|nr:winged helix-turn-helix transcriptional regulator [Limosilactobacillus agrestis]MBB1099680.1 winged helix-turn-helix transcriptional regulator [Limosilactobacillus agrestis]MCD7112362.1 winged helix-turn-helix transcriptional regulator [Limosilactobacillus agrestis]MCD7119537.1 winged helix-turn-helix transcriptional regulator [Limosilactobacillus agrestis]MCD7126547.1 winged helix-turn-helix transcriptional regulator [Limosilactobacillus agrestis]
MMNQETSQGITYTLNFLHENDCPKVLFWLGIKPLNLRDLQELLSGISNNRLITIIRDLQEKYIISPIQESERFVLTTGGEELARLVTSLGVWGRQQMDINNWEDSDQVVLPDSSMEQKELLKYCHVIDHYL